MNEETTDLTGADGWNRLGVLVELAKSMGKRELGRTAIMKFAYLLQEIKKVPLGYSFSLYAYGPFDAAVLEDLSYLRALGALKETTVVYPSGYGYNIKPSSEAGSVAGAAASFVSQHASAIQWAVDQFGNESAGQLELLSTIVFADREKEHLGASQTVAELVRTVGQIKPKFSAESIEHQIERLQAEGMLLSLVPG